MKVVRIGGYHCSVAKNIQELAAVDGATFSMPENIQKLMLEHYGKGFAFIICKFANPKISGHPIAYESSRLFNGGLFIPTRHEHGDDPVVENRQSVKHEGFHCDVCKISPIVGGRWQAVLSPMQSVMSMMVSSKFDMCDVCYANPANTRYRDVPYVRWHQSVEWFTREWQKTPEDLYDHTVYIFNAVVACSPERYSDLQTTRGKKASTLSKNLLQKQAILACQKMTIKGDYANKDYIAFPVEE